MNQFSISKTILFFSLIVFVHVNLVQGQSDSSQDKNDAKEQTKKSTNTMDTISYSAGIMMAQSLVQNGIDELNYTDFIEGMKSVIDKTPGKISPEEAGQILNEYVTAKNAEQSKGQIDAGASFLVENKKRTEVTTTESGLQYEIITKGDGPIPAATDKVKTHYHGMLLDGRVFDSSVERGEAISFPVNGVIMGWQEALQLMPVGSKWKLFIPYNLAYGERGAGGMIGPYETLIFDIELIAIEK